MAAIDTFDWFAEKFFTTPDDQTKQFLREERRYLLSIRNENERLRYIETLMRQTRSSQNAANT